MAVYPAHGVGIIKKIESKKINGKQQNFYIMNIIENNIKIMIPVDNVRNIGVRKVIKADYIPEVYKVLRNIEDFYIDRQTWNRRYKEYTDKLKAGSILSVAEVFRDLYILKLTKTLSFGERKLFDTANSLLIKEIAIAKNTDEKKVLFEIEALFADLPLDKLKEDNNNPQSNKEAVV
ncbi:MAG: CarD family transcriptional regulator [Deltaproteobacteria bacterium]|nr:CarD family transcriptional regulator [Deltaproteobacteria bacterium]